LSDELHGKIALMILIGLTLGLMQATHYTEASHLMGAFIAGLVFCTDHALHVTFVSQFKRILQWLMRIFFASTIGFQVPIKQFGNGKIILQGLFFTLALSGKLAVGFLVPNFTQEKKFTGNHLRDCLIVGCSMAAEGEFAFVIAAFAVDNELIDKDLYSSIVLAILLSTIIAPFSLRFTISYFNKKALAAIKQVEDEMKIVATGPGGLDAVLTTGIKEGTTVFYCINTTSHAAWGTLPALMQTMFKLDLEVIDHRSWHSRFESTVINEVYAKGVLRRDSEIEEELDKIELKVKGAINQEDAIITVTRWMPGIVSEIVESTHDGATNQSNIAEILATEARKKLDKSEHNNRSTDHVMLDRFEMGAINEGGQSTDTAIRARRKRVKVTSTPVGGGVDMFSGGTEVFQPANPLGQRRRRTRTTSTPLSGDMWGDTTTVVLGPGEMVVNIVGPDNKKYAAKMKEVTYKKLAVSNSPLLLVEERSSGNFEGQYLDGFVRRGNKERSVSMASTDENEALLY